MVSRLRRCFDQFMTREDGPTTVEYAVVLALIVAACLAAGKALGTSVSQSFTAVAATIGPRSDGMRS